MTPEQIIDAMRVPARSVVRGAGLWEIRHADLSTFPIETQLMFCRRLLPYTSITMLLRTTEKTLHQPMGECVMEDSNQELRRHLPIMIPGRGRILISGLGLGCVVRGLLAKPDVEHIDVIEIDPGIARLVWPEFQDDPRVTLHMGDAETWTIPDGARWDFAWHDVWSEHESLAVVHARLFARFDDYVDKQGAWMMPRIAMQRMPRRIIGGPRRRRVA